jgi:hypothetical protein
VLIHANIARHLQHRTSSCDGTEKLHQQIIEQDVSGCSPALVGQQYRSEKRNFSKHLVLAVGVDTGRRGDDRQQSSCGRVNRPDE